MKYPLYRHETDHLRLPSGKPIRHFSVESLEAKALTPADLGIHRETLRAQAEIGAQAGFVQFARNLEQAAELTGLPDHEILEIYEALRPGRSSPAELEALAQKIEETCGARLTAEFIREAATVCRHTNPPVNEQDQPRS